MRRRFFVLIALLMVTPMWLAGSCRKAPPSTAAPASEASASAEQKPTTGQPPKKEVTESFTTPSVTSSSLAASSIEELNRQGVLQTIHFAYDQSDLTDDSRTKLEQNGAWLQSHPERKIAIEGHCDERGTVEYNLALGERRARAARDYLASLGIDASRIRVVSYGKERPVDPGSSEEARARNRRAEFVIES